MDSNYLHNLFINEVKGALNSGGGGSGGSGGNAKIPTKLSELENDLFYCNIEEFLRLTAKDFTPVYYTDDEGNPTDNIEYVYYRGDSKLDWFVNPKDDFAYVCSSTIDSETGEKEAFYHNLDAKFCVENGFVQDIDRAFDDSGWCEWFTEAETGFGSAYWCEECGLGVYNGFNALGDPEQPPEQEDAFYVQILGWMPDSHTEFVFYRVNASKIPSSVLEVDLSSINIRLNDLETSMNEVWNQLGNASSLVDTINGEVI